MLSSSWEVNWASQLNGTQKRTQGAVTPSLHPLCHPALPPQATGRRKRVSFIFTHTYPQGLAVCRQQPGDPNPAPPWTPLAPSRELRFVQCPSRFTPEYVNKNHVQRHKFKPGNGGMHKLHTGFSKPRNPCAKL